jgi:ABC-2 type transport system permease protein
VKRLEHIWLIAVKDLRLFMTDRMALIFFFAFPFVLIIMFNLLLANVGGSDARMELHLATQEKEGGLSGQIIAAMETKDESKLKPGDPKIVWDRDVNRALADVQSGKLAGFILFPEDFTRGVDLGYGTKLEVVSRAEATEVRMALLGMADSIASRVGAQHVEMSAAIGLLVQQSVTDGSSGNSPDIQQIIAPLFQNQDGSNSQSLITFQSESLGEVKAKNPAFYVVPGYLVMFVFFAGALGSEGLIRERRNYTLERLLASSVKKESLLGGIYLGNVLKGLVQIAIFWIVGILAFHIDLGVAPGAVIGVSLLVVLMSAAFSVMLGTLAKTERAASALGVATSLILAPLGGCWWPLFITPHWMQFVAMITPHGWANTAFMKLMLFGGDASAVALEMAVLAAFAAAFLIVGIVRFRTDADVA